MDYRCLTPLLTISMPPRLGQVLIIYVRPYIQRLVSMPPRLGQVLIIYVRPYIQRLVGMPPRLGHLSFNLLCPSIHPAFG